MYLQKNFTLKNGAVVDLRSSTMLNVMNRPTETGDAMRAPAGDRNHSNPTVGATQHSFIRNRELGQNRESVKLVPIMMIPVWKSRDIMREICSAKTKRSMAANGTVVDLRSSTMLNVIIRPTETGDAMRNTAGDRIQKNPAIGATQHPVL